MIAWGSYPMVPWAGRIRRGRFDFQGRSYQLPLNLDEHAIHGVAFAMPRRIDAHSRGHAELTSDCTHWVVYDETGHATCIEPQSGPPDGFNLDPIRLSPGTTVERWFLLEWL